MDLQQYVQDAIRTESKIETIHANKKALTQVLSMIIAAGSMLDQIKKNVFYNKPINTDIFDRHAFVIDSTIQQSSSYGLFGSHNPSEDLEINPRVFHAIVGAITESAELAEALKKGLADSSLDLVNVLEEFGDINWYEAIAVDALDGDFEEILTRNIAKLKARFPDKYTDEKANNRDLVTERSILEGNG